MNDHHATEPVVRPGTMQRLGLNRVALQSASDRERAARQMFVDAFQKMIDSQPTMDEIAASQGIWHVDGRTWWNDAPLPPRWHKCHPWTLGLGYERCPCGGLRESASHLPGAGLWRQRNSRRKNDRTIAMLLAEHDIEVS
jgi:hypothetical protein